MIAIFKGDDTAFAGANSIRVTIGTSISLAGCRAEFNLCGIVKQIPDASTGTFTVAFTAEETAAMPLGVQLATVRVFDTLGRVRTASNTVRVLVTDRVGEAYRNANAADVTLASPGGIIDDGEGVPTDLPEDYTPDEMRTFLNRLAALIRNSMAAFVALFMLPLAAQDWTNRVSTARFGAVRAMSNVVTSVDLSGFITNAPAPGDYETVSNRAMGAIQTETDPTVPAWAKAETPPASGLTTNDVQEIVTNETVVGWSEWTFTGNEAADIGGHTWAIEELGDDPDFPGTYTFELQRDGGRYTPRTYAYEVNPPLLYFEDFIVGEPGEEDVYVSVTATRTPITRNSLGLARLTDLPPLTNGLASAASVSAANSRAASAQSAANAASNTAVSVAATVTTWETFWDGDNVRVTVTNYDSAVNLPSLYIEYKMENTNDYRTVWDERTRWQTNEVKMAELRSAVLDLDEAKANKAWGYYDSHSLDANGHAFPAPDGYTWISSPRIAIAGGLAYQRTLTTDGAVWVLASNNMVAQSGGDTENGFFRIKDDEGNVTFEIVRGNKRTVGATAAGIKVESSGSSHTITIPYNVVSAAPPTLYGTTDLSSGEWTELTSATWISNVSGAYTGVVTTASNQYFIKAEYETGGETYIRNAAPISVDGGLYATNTASGGYVKIRPKWNGSTITWEIVP